MNQYTNEVSNQVLRLADISKEFGGVKALSQVYFDLRAGEIHALVGENGAGKSTLLKIISGVIGTGSYAGDYIFNGLSASFSSIVDAQRKGIVLIHQELALVPELSVFENIVLGNENTNFGYIDRAESRTRAEKALLELGFQVNIDLKLDKLGIGQKQVVEIAKALTRNFEVLVLDEPTAALSERETEQLVKLLRKLKADGRSIIYVSHRLPEVFQIADRITVLRDGHSVGTYNANDLNDRELIRLMVGRDAGIEARQKTHREKSEREVLKVDGVWPLSVMATSTKNKSLRPVTLSVKAGEIVGIAGLVGSGRSEFLEMIFGIRESNQDSSILIDSNPKHFKSPCQAISEGVALVSEDRKESGLILDQSIRSNVSLITLKQFTKVGWINSLEESREVSKICNDLKVKARSYEDEVASLSGGNQQKIVLAKWLLMRPKLVLLDEPTRGVDIGAKDEIYGVISQLAAQGVAILVVSSELPELITLCDRIITFSDGYMSGEFSKERTSQEELLQAMTAAFRENELH